MDTFSFSSDGVEHTVALGEALGRALERGSFVALKGPLGAGKTQFTQGIAAGLGVREAVASPTFNLVFEYETGRIPLYHFDLYRLESASDLEDIDFYALTDETSGGASVVEWADKFASELPDDRLELAICYGQGEGMRRLEACAYGVRSQALLDAWKAQVGQSAQAVGQAQAAGALGQEEAQAVAACDTQTTPEAAPCAHGREEEGR